MLGLKLIHVSKSGSCWLLGHQHTKLVTCLKPANPYVDTWLMTAAYRNIFFLYFLMMLSIFRSKHLPIQLSICGWNLVHSLSSIILAWSISFLHILSTNFRRCIACWLFYYCILHHVFGPTTWPWYIHPWWSCPMTSSMTLNLYCVYFSPTRGYPRLLCSQPDNWFLLKCKYMNWKNDFWAKSVSYFKNILPKGYTDSI